jgi:DNA-binding IclR family transcriptional regulator
VNRAMSDIEERLLSFLKEHPGSSPREIADALGEPLQKVRSVLAKLRDRGLVARGDEGKYYAVMPALRGLPRRDVRRNVVHRLSPDVEALLAAIEELITRVEALERRVERLEKELEYLKTIASQD